MAARIQPVPRRLNRKGCEASPLFRSAPVPGAETRASHNDPGRLKPSAFSPFLRPGTAALHNFYSLIAHFESMYTPLLSPNAHSLNHFRPGQPAASLCSRCSSSRSTSSPNGSCCNHLRRRRKGHHPRIFQPRPLRQHRRGVEPVHRQQHRAGHRRARRARRAVSHAPAFSCAHGSPARSRFGLIFGGIIGNLTDRLLPGRHAVVDFLHFYLQRRGAQRTLDFPRSTSPTPPSAPASR